MISSRSVLVTWYDSGLGDNQINTDGRRVYTVKYNALSGECHVSNSHYLTPFLASFLHMFAVIHTLPYINYQGFGLEAQLS